MSDPAKWSDTRNARFRSTPEDRARYDERATLRRRLSAALLAASFSDWDVGDGTVIELPLDVAVATVVKVLGGSFLRVIEALDPAPELPAAQSQDPASPYLDGCSGTGTETARPKENES